MHGSSTKARPDTNVLHRLPASLAVPGQMRQPWCAVHMQPMQVASDAHAGFISMLRGRHTEPGGNLLYRRGKSLRCLLYPAQQVSLREMTAADFIEHFAGPCHQQQL